MAFTYAEYMAFYLELKEAVEAAGGFILVGYPNTTGDEPAYHGKRRGSVGIWETWNKSPYVRCLWREPWMNFDTGTVSGLEDFDNLILFSFLPADLPAEEYQLRLVFCPKDEGITICDDDGRSAEFIAAIDVEERDPLWQKLQRIAADGGGFLTFTEAGRLMVDYARNAISG